MKFEKTFVATAKKVVEVNATILPDVFTPVGEPEVTDITWEEIAALKTDDYGKYIFEHKGQVAKAKLGRNVATGLKAYNLQLMESNREIKIKDQMPIPAGLPAWRLVAA